MFSTIFSLFVFLGILFVFGKVLQKIARFCSPRDLMETLGESFAMRGGDFSSARKD